ncbi:MAG: DNA methyltransferase, partial [Promethearchaeota archaeon]
MSTQDFFTFINKVIIDFEIEKSNDRNIGEIYTPQPIVDYIVSNIFKLYFKECFNFPKYTNSDSFFNQIKKILFKNDKLKKLFIENLKKIKILDPASGSGRFIISTARILHYLWKNLNSGLDDYEIKRNIVQDNIYGIEIEKSAYIITKLRLISWLFSGHESKCDLHNSNVKSLNLEEINQIINKIGIKFNLYNLDFLLEFESEKYDIIIGNPPYVENK